MSEEERCWKLPLKTARGEGHLKRKYYWGGACVEKLRSWEKKNNGGERGSTNGENRHIGTLRRGQWKFGSTPGASLIVGEDSDGGQQHMPKEKGKARQKN